MLEKHSNIFEKSLPAATNLAQASDEEILELSIKKPSCFEVIVERYQDAFLRKAKSIVRTTEEAEDIVQEVFTKVYLNANRFQSVPGASFKSWAYKILINTSFTHYQKTKRRAGVSVTLEPEVYQELPDMGNDIEESVMRDYVASIISRLPKTLGRILTLHFLEDISQKDIAEKEGISVSAVKTRIHRAKKEFKKIEPHLVL